MEIWPNEVCDKRQVGLLAYHLKLPHGMRQLYQCSTLQSCSLLQKIQSQGENYKPCHYLFVVDGEEEQEVEKILDSRWHWRRFQFLVKQKSFSREHNSWEVASNVKAPDLVMEYYQKHPATLRHIHQIDFYAIFNPRTITSRCSNLGGGINVRGPLTHDSGVSSVVSQHNFIVQTLVTIREYPQGCAQ